MVDAPAQDDSENSPTPTATARFITDPSNNARATGVQVSGTYDGVSGTFTCIVPNTCTGSKADIILTGLVSLATGVRSFATNDDWSFKPGSITTPVKADQADQDDAYLYFGVWSSIPDNISGETYNFRYVAGGGAEHRKRLSQL